MEGGDVLGQAQVRNEIVTKHLPLVWSIKDPEARARAALQLVEAVDLALRKGEVDNISGYLKLVTRNAVTDAARDEIRERVRIKKTVPANSRMRAKGEEITTHATIIRRGDANAQLEAREELEAGCRDELDRAIIELLLKGFSQKEAKDLLGMSYTRFNVRFQAISERIRDRA